MLRQVTGRAREFADGPKVQGAFSAGLQICTCAPFALLRSGLCPLAAGAAIHPEYLAHRHGQGKRLAGCRGCPLTKRFGITET